MKTITLAVATCVKTN